MPWTVQSEEIDWSKVVYLYRELCFHRELRFSQLKAGAANVASAVERQQQEVFGGDGT